MDKKEKFSIFAILFGVLSSVGLMWLSEYLKKWELTSILLQSFSVFVIFLTLVGIIVFLLCKILKVK
jgi:O-antigen/teichoic acid export membrane protein